MKRHSLILFLVGSLIVFSFESCVRSVEKVHSVELRKLDPALQGVRKSFSNRQINDVSTWEYVRKPELIDYYENYKINGAVEFKNVAFAYPGRLDVTVLNNINLTAAKGQQIALVGPSGAGKSTVASLLLQFYKTTAGDIYYDNKNVNDANCAGANA